MDNHILMYVTNSSVTFGQIYNSSGVAGVGPRVHGTPQSLSGHPQGPNSLRTRLLPIMLKNLPIILFYYSAANWYYSKKTRPLFQQFCKVFTHYSSNFPDQHIHSKETSKFMHYIVT